MPKVPQRNVYGQPQQQLTKEELKEKRTFLVKSLRSIQKKRELNLQLAEMIKKSPMKIEPIYEYEKDYKYWEVAAEIRFLDVQQQSANMGQEEQEIKKAIVAIDKQLK